MVYNRHREKQVRSGVSGAMRSDHDALLRAICNNPRENLPRLAFADWLEEHGQTEDDRTRAQFIRADVGVSLRDEWDADRLRWEEELDPQVLSKMPWFVRAYPEPGPNASYSWGGPPLLRRGFRWSATVWNRNPPVFGTEATKLFAQHPIEHLTFFDHHPNTEQLVDEPWFPQLTGLGWTDGRCSAKILRPLLKSAPAGLVELTLLSRAVNPDGMRALGASALFRNLTHLELSGTGPRIIGATLDALTRFGSAYRLRSLKIGFDSLNREAATLAACLPASLRVLNLSATQLHTTGTRAFVEALTTSELRFLDLSHNGIDDDNARALFTSPRLAGLKMLALRFSYSVGDGAVQVLLEKSPLADGLNRLAIDCNASAEMKKALKKRMGERVRFTI
jgi:uncharacterized protein (TIGR02996 family)